MRKSGIKTEYCATFCVRLKTVEYLGIAYQEILNGSVFHEFVSNKTVCAFVFVFHGIRIVSRISKYF